METIALKTERLTYGDYVTRPAASFGTCGWAPFAWTMAVGKTASASRALFLKNHAKQLEGVKVEHTEG